MSFNWKVGGDQCFLGINLGDYFPSCVRTWAIITKLLWASKVYLSDFLFCQYGASSKLISCIWSSPSCFVTNPCIQNSANMCKVSSITPIFKELHWLPVKHCSAFKTVTLVYKFLHSGLYTVFWSLSPVAQLWLQYQTLSKCLKVLNFSKFSTIHSQVS